jgi:mRNA interferase RelE/StbE
MQHRVIQALRRYTDTGQSDVVKLHGHQDEWRLRVGEHRVRFQRDATTRTIVVLRVRHRREAY